MQNNPLSYGKVAQQSSTSPISAHLLMTGLCSLLDREPPIIILICDTEIASGDNYIDRSGLSL